MQKNIEAADTTALRSIGGFAFAAALNLSIIEIRGVDAARYLQAQTTNDINALLPGSGQSSCFIDRKARPIAVFQIFNSGDRYAIICDTRQSDALLAHLDKFRFADQVEFEDLSNSRSSVAVQGPRSRLLLKSLLDGIPSIDLFKHDVAEFSIAERPVTSFKLSLTGEEGFLLTFAAEAKDALCNLIETKARELGMIELDADLMNTARIEAGLVKLGVDFSDENLLAETTLDESAVSYSKGCFQGQEVLARLRTQGSPTRALVGLTIENANVEPYSIGAELVVAGETIGWLKSNCYSKFLKRFIAIALLKRDYRTPGKTWTAALDGKSVEITVSLLPFYQSRSTESIAQELYEEALQVFANEDEEQSSDDSGSIRLLRDALVLNPVFEDAYESLGVILHKRGRLDEAIELMEFLSRLNPESVMAHTNLSVFYIEKGWKEKAEEEKAVSMSIRMRIAAQQMAKQKEEEKQRDDLHAEAEERLSMFRQVLEIDSEDQLANYGSGDCLVQLGRFDEALNHLQKAIDLKPNHSVAYLALGQAFEGLKRLSEAKNAYERGIDVAAKRGDMEPLKKMQERLAMLS